MKTVKIMTPKKYSFSGLKLNRNGLIIAFLLFFTATCQSQEVKYDQIKDYLHSISDTLDIKNYNSIFYVSEIGCHSCVKAFSDAVQQYVFDNERALIILNAKGRVFSTDSYLHKGVSNVVCDYTGNFYRLHIASTSCIITLKENAVDSVIVLDAYKISDQLNMIPEIVNMK